MQSLLENGFIFSVEIHKINKKPDFGNHLITGALSGIIEQWAKVNQ